MALTKYNFNSFDVTPVASNAFAFDADADGLATAASGAMTLIKSQTASSSANVNFVNGASDVVLDGTYNNYCFKFINIHPATADAIFQFNVSDDTSSHAYNIAKTSTTFTAHHFKDGSQTSLTYQTDYHLAQATGAQYLTGGGINNNNDDAASGELCLFSPSDTTFAKHFMARANFTSSNPYSRDAYTVGYINTTAAITAVQFNMSSGNIDNGIIKLYGISK